MPEIYMLLYAYAGAEDRPFTGEPVAPRSSSPLRRFELEGEESEQLLEYAEADL